MIQQIALLAFVAISGLIVAVFMMVRASRMTAREALRQRLGRLAPAQDLLRADAAAGSDRGIGLALTESGLDWSSVGFYVRMALAAALGAALGLSLGAPLLAVAFAVGSAGALYAFVRHAQELRRRRCEEQMPRALEIMNMALRAGHPLPRALELAAEESPLPLRVELRRAVDEQALGRPSADVVTGLGARLQGCPTVSAFVVAVLVLQETGGNLIAVLERIIENARSRTRYEKRLQALTSEGRTSAKVLALLPAAFLLLSAATDPGYIRFFLADTTGQTIAAACLLWWCTGIVAMRRMMNKASKA